MHGTPNYCRGMLWRIVPISLLSSPIKDPAIVAGSCVRTCQSTGFYICRSQSQILYFCCDQSRCWRPTPLADWTPQIHTCRFFDPSLCIVFLLTSYKLSHFADRASLTPQDPSLLASLFGQSRIVMTSSHFVHNKRKAKAPTLRERDWEPYKDVIIDMHISQGMSLPKVRSFLEEKHGFIAELVSQSWGTIWFDSLTIS